MHTEISVIIPVYNAEDYVEECIKSVMAQEFDSFELILINDGSTDDSASICKSYCSLYKNIRYYEKVNGGASSARNFGIKKAKGRLLTFVDSDDYIKNDYLKKLSDAQKEKDYDWTSCSYKNTNDNGGIKRSNKAEWNKNISLTKKEKVRKFIPSKVLACPSGKRTLASVCCKLYKKSIIQDNNLLFDEKLKICEDQMFNLQYSFLIESFCYIHKFLYIRNLHNGSLFTGFRPNMTNELVSLFKSYESIIKKNKYIPIAQHQFVLEKIREYLTLFIFHEDNNLKPSVRYSKLWNVLKTEPIKYFWNNAAVFRFRGTRYKLQVLALKLKLIWLWPYIK